MRIALNLLAVSVWIRHFRHSMGGVADMKNLHDLDGAEVDAHPDGLAWRKACDVCAHRNHDPQEIGDAYRQRMREYDGTAVFYCLHRDDECMTRICASYAAINRLPRLSK